MNELHLGETYSRVEISQMLGGSIIEYMPASKGAVLCVCLTKEMNPEAPNVVLVGKGKPVELAEIFLQQSWVVPVFVKQRENEWEYVGDYRAKGAERDRAKVGALGAQAGRLDVAFVLYLQQL